MRFASPFARLAQNFHPRLGQKLQTVIFPAAFSLAALSAGAAHADGFPRPGQITFEEAVTPIAHEMHFFHNWILLPIITVICLFVLALLAYVIFRFNETNKSGRGADNA